MPKIKVKIKSIRRVNLKYCDLHTHSFFSDGTSSPTEIINLAKTSGLSAVALCDHNTVDGLNEFISAAEGTNVEAIPGIEFSTDYNGKELHLIGLYIPKSAFQQVTDFMEAFTKSKEESNFKLIESLNKAGYKIDFETIKAKTPNGKFNRAHIGAELVSLGYYETIKQAFDNALSPAAGHYTKPARFTVWEAIDYVKSIGAIPILAHPFLDLTEEELKEFLPKAKDRGLVGMECYYSLFDDQTTQKAFELAKRYGLKPSGGSDFHGSNKPDIKLGIGKGNLRIPYDFLSDIKSKTAE